MNEDSEGVTNPGFELGGDEAVTDTAIADLSKHVGDPGDQSDKISRDNNHAVRRHHSEVPKSSKKHVNPDPDVIIEEDYDDGNDPKKLQRSSKKKTTPVARHHTEVLRKRTNVSNLFTVPEASSAVATRRSLSREGSRAQRFSRLQYVAEDTETSASFLKCRHSDEFLTKRALIISQSSKLLHDFTCSIQSNQHVNTKDFQRARKTLEHKHLVLIAGRRGSGKTHIAMKLAESVIATSHLFSPMFISNLKDLRILVESHQDAVVVVDDFSGKFRFMEEAADEIQAVWNNVQYLIEQKKIYLILACETSHFRILRQTKKFSFIGTFLSGENIIEIDEDKNHLTKDEKTKLMKYIGRKLHSSFKATDMEDLSTLRSKKYGFPLLCQLVSLGASFTDLQESPDSFLMENLNKIFNSEIKLYITIVVLLVFGKLNVSKFKANERYILDKIASLLDVDERVINDSTLRVVAKASDDTYITKVKGLGTYEIGSKFLIECVTKHLINKLGDDVLGILPLQIIGGLQLFHSSMAESEKTEERFCDYHITNLQYKYVVDRFKDIISTDEPDLLTLASCAVWNDENFVDMTLTIIGVDNFLIEKSNNLTLLAALARSNKLSAIKHFLGFISEFRPDLIKDKHDQIKHAMLIACKYKNRKSVVEILFQFCDINHDELMCAAAESGDKNLFDLLVKRGVPYIDRKGRVIDLLSMYGHIDIIKKYIEDCSKTVLYKKGHKGNTLLHSAVMSTNSEFVEYLMNEGADPEVVNRDGVTVLHIASMYGRIHTVKLLCVRIPKLLHHRDNNGFTALHFAAREGHLDVLSYLIDQNLSGTVKVVGSNTALHLAAYNGQTEVLMYLLKKYPDLIQAQNNESFTAPQIAARIGHVGALQACFDAGLSPDSKTVDGRTFLHLSAFNGRFTLVKHLCTHFPNLIEITDADGNTFAHDAAASGNLSVVEFIIQSYISVKTLSKDGCTILHDACYYGRLEVSQYLVQQCPDLLHMKTTGGYTPCHGAALGGYVDLFKFLASSGADPFALSNDNSTALHEAAFSGKFEMVKYLSETYPELFVKRNKMDYIAVHFAAQEGHVEILSYLMTLSNQHTIETKENQTLLHIAAYNNRFETVKYICEFYPDIVTRQDRSGATAIHYASRGGNIDICSYLIEKVGDPVLKTGSGSTILHLACYDGHFDLVKHICERYPSLIDEVDETGHNAAHYAAGSGSVDLLKFVLSRGVDPLSRTDNGSTLLLKAAYNGKKDIVHYLCARYPEIVRLTDNFGCNLAHYAVCGGNIQVLLFGIYGYIDPMSVTSDGHSLLHIAAFHGQIQIVKYLCENFPELRKIKDNADLGPEHFAHEGQQENVIQYLVSLNNKPLSTKLMPAEDSPDGVTKNKCQPFCDCILTCLRCHCTRDYALNIIHGFWRRIIGCLCFFRRN